MADTNRTAPPPYGQPISLEKAKKVMAAAEAEANANGWPMAITILDSSGCLKLMHRLDNANQGAAVLSQRKAESAIKFRAPTRMFEEILVSGTYGSLMLAMGPDLLPVGGGIPLIERGEVIGSIGVSGMQPLQDGQVASAGARLLEG
jgi:glc operon protein GlcG